MQSRGDVYLRHIGRRRRVTAVHKANVLRRVDGLSLEACEAVAAGYPDVFFDDCIVDAFAMRLTLHPELVDVVVTTNMFGGILSDVAAGLVGGLGLAPGINAGKDRAMAEAVHGSAPDIAGRGIANPIAEILSGALLLRWQGSPLSVPLNGRSSAGAQRPWTLAVTLAPKRSLGRS